MIEELVSKTEDGKPICYMCGRIHWIEWHHVFGGPDRKSSERYGLVVPLCHWCHNEPPNGVHHNRENMDKLRAAVQKLAMEHYGWTVEEFREIFGRSYI